MDIWRETLKLIEDKLKAEQTTLAYSIYKFLGDGWVLIIDPETDKAALLSFFAELCYTYCHYFKEEVEKHLSTKISPIGLTFGLDIGNIFSVDIGGNQEFMGPPLNIAARLQSCITNQNIKGDNPANQLMMIRRNYIKHFKSVVLDQYAYKKAERTLKNIRNNDTFVCSRIWLKEA